MSLSATPGSPLKASKLPIGLRLIVLLLTALFSLFIQSHGSFYEWKAVPLGAGGYVTGIDIHPSGFPVYCRTDVGGAYRLNSDGSSWAQVVTSDSMPAADIGFYRYGGVASIVSAPSDPNRAYLAFEGRLYYSDDRGDTWTRSTYPDIAMDPNARNGRFTSERLEVDPANKDVVYYGSNEDGLLRSTDGGVTWSTINSVPVGSSVDGDYPGVKTVVVDGNSGTVGGRRAVVYAFVEGAGVYRSSDGGSNFSLLTPDNIEDAEIANDGTLWAVSESGKKVFRYRNGNWEDKTQKSRSWVSIAVNPANSNEAWILDRGKQFQMHTTDGGDNWDRQYDTRTATDIPWLDTADLGYFSTAELQYDATRDVLWYAQGIGVWQGSNIRSETVDLTSVSAGIEELVVNDILANDLNGPVVAVWDRGVFHIQDLDTYRDHYSPDGVFTSGWDVAACASQPAFIAAIIQDQSNNDSGEKFSGYSTDGGESFTAFASLPAESDFGNIAVAANDPDNIVWVPAVNFSAASYPIYYTTDRGVSWNVVNQSERLFWTADQAAQILQADPVLPNTFYAYSQQGKLLCSTDGGQSWQVRNDEDIPRYGFHSQLKTVAGHEGFLLFAKGRFSTEEDMGTGEAYYSQDGGYTWTELVGTTKVTHIAGGKAPDGSSDPTIFVAGKINGTRGVYRSTDLGESWTFLKDYPGGIYSVPNTFEADPFIYGRIYVGFRGNGAIFGQPREGGGPTNAEPFAHAGPDQTVTDSDNDGFETILLDGSASTDEDGFIRSYAWSWAGGMADGMQPTVTLPVGMTTVTLTVVDDDNATNTATVRITVLTGSTSSVEIQAPSSKELHLRGATLTFIGHAVSGSGDDISDRMQWTSSIDGELGSGSSVEVNWLAVGEHIIRCRVVDDNDQTASDEILLRIRPPLETQSYFAARSASASDSADRIVASSYTTGYLEFDLGDTLINNVYEASLRLYQKSDRQGSVQVSLLEGSFNGEEPPDDASAFELGSIPLANVEDTWIMVPLDLSIILDHTESGEPLTLALNTDTGKWTHFSSHASSEPPELILEVGQSMLGGYYEWADDEGLTGEDRHPDQMVNGSGLSNFERYLFGNEEAGQSSVFQPLDVVIEESDLVVRIFQKNDSNLRYTLLGSGGLKEWRALWRSAGDANMEGMQTVWIERGFEEGSLYVKLKVSTF